MKRSLILSYRVFPETVVVLWLLIMPAQRAMESEDSSSFSQEPVRVRHTEPVDSSFYPPFDACNVQFNTQLPPVVSCHKISLIKALSVFHLCHAYCMPVKLKEEADDNNSFCDNIDCIVSFGQDLCANTRYWG